MTGTPAGRGKKTTALTGELKPCEGSSLAAIGFHSSEKFPEIMTPGGKKKEEEEAFLLQRTSGKCTVVHTTGAVWCSEGIQHDRKM